VQRLLRPVAGSADGVFLWLLPQSRGQSGHCPDPEARSPVPQAAAQTRRAIAGCGLRLGGLARHAARFYDVEVHGITLSKAQLELANRRTAEAGLEDRVRLELLDYRDLPGRENFDKIVSVGMFEHVGHRNLDRYFAILHEQVKP